MQGLFRVLMSVSALSTWSAAELSISTPAYRQSAVTLKPKDRVVVAAQAHLRCCGSDGDVGSCLKPCLPSASVRVETFNPQTLNP